MTHKQKNWVILLLAIGCGLGVASYIKHKDDIETIEGSVLNCGYSPIEV